MRFLLLMIPHAALPRVDEEFQRATLPRAMAGRLDVHWNQCLLTLHTP